jgi:hypothetical protein
VNIKLDTSDVRQIKWYEYAERFLYGGAMTVAAGIIAKRFGPVFGGLFLAFPAIFPASATLVEKHEKEKKQKAGLNGNIRGRRAAGAYAAGTMMGAVGLASFAWLVWKLLPSHSAWLTLSVATLLWFIVGAGLWLGRKMMRGGRLSNVLGSHTTA